MFLLLRLLSFIGGLPTQTQSDGRVKLHLTSTPKLAFNATLSVLLGTHCFLLILITQIIGYFGFENLFLGPRKFGLSITSALSMCFYFTFAICALTVFLVVLIGKRKKIQDIFDRFDHLTMRLDNKRKNKIVSDETTFCLWLLGINIAGCIMAYYPCSGIAVALNYSYTFRVILGTVLAISLSNLSLSPLCTSIQLVTGWLLKATAVGLDHWASVARAKAEAKRKENQADKTSDAKPYLPVEAWSSASSELEELINEGEGFLDFLDEFNDVFGGILFVIFAKCTISVVTCALFVSSVYCLFFVQSSIFFIMFMAVSVPLMIVALLRLSCFIALGQEVLNSLVSAKRSAQLLGIEFCGDLSERDRLRLDALRDNLGGSEGVVSCNCFNLSMGSAMATFGLLLTYSLVLFQFQITEGIPVPDLGETTANATVS